MNNIRKILYNIAINDLDYPVSKRIVLDTGIKRNIICPYYAKWHSMLLRCYNEKHLIKNPSYKGCSVSEDWLRASNFKSWMEQQDWEGKHLDKDLLFQSNKVYSPETCIFISSRINSFIIENHSKRGEYPIGVFKQKTSEKYNAMCRSVVDGKNTHLGYYQTVEEAHKAWLDFKLQQAHILANEEKDEKVGKALILKYENYKNMS